MAAAVVESQGLIKTFGATPVLREVELRLFAGTAAMIIGGNGAGKSTLLRIFAGLSQPNAGQVLIFGKDSRSLGARYRRRIGMLTHQSWLYPNLSARENLEFYAQLYGLGDPAGIAAKWIEQIGLRASADEMVRGFSRGMEQRLSLARAMINAPELLLLDEPFAALDADGVGRATGLIRAQIERRCAVLITAHAVLELGIEAERYQIVRGRVTPYQDESRRGRLRSLLGV
jgi:heme exporter protein A